MQLEMFLGMSEDEANSEGNRGTYIAYKLAGTTDFWSSDDSIDSYSEFGISGFNAIPAGERTILDVALVVNPGGYRGDYGYAWFWTSSETSGDNVWCRLIHWNHSGVGRVVMDKGYGYSIRCLKD